MAKIIDHFKVDPHVITSVNAPYKDKQTIMIHLLKNIEKKLEGDQLFEYDKSILYISSADRLDKYGKKGKFSVVIEGGIRSIKYLELHSIELPNCFSNIRKDKDNQFGFSWKQTNGSFKDETIVLKEGNYSLDDIQTEIENQMNSLSDTTYNFVIEYEPYTYKFRITENKKKLKDWYVRNIPYNFYRKIGIEKFFDNPALLKVEPTLVSGGTDYEFVADNIFNLSGDSYIYVCSNIISNLLDDVISVGSTDNTSKRFNSLAKLSLDTSFGSIIHFKPSTRIVYRVDSKYLTNIKFWLESNERELVEMPLDWSISFITYSQKESNLYNQLDSFNKFELD